MKKTCSSTAMTAANPSLVSLAALFKKTRTRLFAVAMSLATLAQVFGQPVITNQPQNQTNVAGATATFTVGATGAEPLSYQWRSYANATSFTNIPFGTAATLVLTNVQYTTRQFAVVVTDSGGLSVTSSPLATITWLLALTSQPTDQIVVAGATASFMVTATGTAPRAYQWYFNTTNLPGQTNASLTLPLVSDLNTGDYFVTVMNPYGAETSRVARLTVRADMFTKITAGPGRSAGISQGAAWGDYDNDGFIDLFVPQGGSARHFLYHNNTNGTFSFVTNGPVATVVSDGRAAVWGDYDNDGYLDLVLVNINQPNHLFHNNGAGSFAAVPNAAIVSDSADSYSVTWVDYDNDGYLDLFRAAQPHRLYSNNHNGTFTRITQGAFLTVPGDFFAVAWGDYNNDGRPDLFLPQATESSGLPSYLYRNDGGGTFTPVGVGAFNGPSNGRAAVWGDYDNDGDLDLFVSCFSTEGRPNRFYRNNGDGTFTSLTSLPANDPENQGGASVSCNWGDYDNDGWLDLFVANRYGQNDFLYHNNGDGTFTKVLGSIAVKDAADSRCPAWGDYDNDGFLDLFVSTFEGGNFLYHNNTNDNHWLTFRLIGTQSNRAAIGAKVRVRATINGQSFWQMREISGGDGRNGQNSLYVHVGLGNATNADLVRIEWPSGTVQELENVTSKQFLTVIEPARLQALGAGVLRIQSWKGMAFEVQASADLEQWSPLTTVTNLTGMLEFTDPNVANQGSRFYRAVLR